MRLTSKLAQENEELVMKSKDEDPLTGYVFSNSRWVNVPFSAKAKITLTSLLSQEFLTWNFVLAIVILLLNRLVSTN